MPIIINGETVDDSLIREETAMLRPQYEAAMAGQKDPIEMEMELKEWSRENVIERVLLRQEALKDPEPVPAEALDDGGDETRIRLERLLNKLNAGVSVPKSKDVTAYYKKHKEQFFTPELVHAWHIVKNVDENQDEAAARAAIEAAQGELASAPFAEVADRHSDCAGNGGNLGLVPRGEMVQEFEDVVFALKPGETSAIFRSPFGFHIAHVSAHFPEGHRPQNDVTNEIRDILLREKQERALELYLDKLRASADVQFTKAKESQG